MSVDFEYANCCKGERCTNLLTARTDALRGYCGLCYEDVNTCDGCGKEFMSGGSVGIDNVICGDCLKECENV